MKKIIVGDLHGNYVGLSNLLDKVNYDETEDFLIFVGDYNDHFPNMRFDTNRLVEELLSLKYGNENVHFVLGNHDKWFKDYLNHGKTPRIWLTQGGEETIDSYVMDIEHVVVPESHRKFYNDLVPYYIDEDLIVVHGGLPPNLFAKVARERTLSEEEVDLLLWDREVVFAWNETWFEEFRQAFGDRAMICGHTAYLGPFKNANMPWYMIDVDFRGAGLCAAVLENGEIQLITLGDE